MIQDLRSHLERLEEEGQLIRVKKEVDPRYEVTAVAKLLHKTYRKAVIFEKVKGSSFSLVSYAFPTRESVANSLNMNAASVLPQWSAREATRAPYQIVDTGPVKEVVELDPDLYSLPITTHCQGDGGAYITGGVVIARHPEQGTQNASFNRLQLVGRDKLHVRMMPPQHLGMYFEDSERLDQPLQAAIVIGAPPSVMFSAASKIPIERDELEFAGALGGFPLRVTKCITNEVLVPADAEIVIEGEVLPHIREDEGPFGEFTDGYVPVMKNHVFRAKAITHRHNPLYHDILAGGKEDLLLLGVPIEAEVYKEAKKYAKITGVATNSFVFGAVIGLHKENEEQPKNVLLAALASYAWIKMAIVVDEDVDIYDPEDVLWAIQTRCHPERDIFVVPGVSSYTREDVRSIHVGKVGIDATAPLDKKEILRRRSIPGEDTIKIEDYLEG